MDTQTENDLERGGCAPDRVILPGSAAGWGNVRVRVARNYLYPHEIQLLLKGIKKFCDARYVLRNELMIRVRFNYGMRANEICQLVEGDLDLGPVPHIFVRREKNSYSKSYPLGAIDARLLRRLIKQNQKLKNRIGTYVFQSKDGGPITPHGFRDWFSPLGVSVGLSLHCYPHQLKAACAIKVSRTPGMTTGDVQSYLGHKSLTSTEKYLKELIAMEKFEGMVDNWLK